MRNRRNREEMFRKIFILTIISVHFLFSTAFAVEVAPRITDREIVKGLTELKAGQKYLNQRINDVNTRIDDVNTRIDDLDKKLSQRIDDTNQRIDDLDKKLSQRIDDLDRKLSQRIDGTNQRIDDLDKKLSQRINDLDRKLSQRIDDTNRRIDDTNQRISDLYDINLTMFAILAALITGLFGYIIWDRRTMMKPVQERLERLEKDIERDLELRNEHGSIPARLLNVLRELAKTDAKLAAVLRSFSLL